MRELKLRYFIELASNIGAKSRAEAQAVEQSQRAMQSSVERTGASMQRLDTAYARFGANNATERQVGYMRRLAQGIDHAKARMRELGQLSGAAIQDTAAAVAGVAAGAAASKAMLDKPVEYDMKLRAVTATAFAGDDLKGLRTGLIYVSNLIEDTVRDVSGAPRESALGAYEKLVGSGSFTKDESAALLPTVMKASVASGADANDLVMAAEKMKVNFGLTPNQIGEALSKVMRGGQEGGFEIADSAKWIGPLADMFKGYKGMAGIEAMVTMLQQVRSTAGTNDQAANNLRAFLKNISAESTRGDFKKQGIDLDKEMAKGAAKGLTPVDVYMTLLERVMAKQDPEGKARKAMQDADKNLSPKERAQRYQAIADIYKNAGIAKIIADTEEMGGYTGLAGTKEYGKKVLASVQGESGNAVETGYKFMSEGTGSKFTDVGNRISMSMSNALDSGGGMLSEGIDKVVKLTDEFPNLTTAVVAAGSALAALTGVAGTFSFLASKRGAPPIPPPSAGPKVSPGPWPKLDGAPAAAGSGVGTKAASGLRALGWIGASLSLGYELFGTSDADLATLAAADARKENAARPMNWRGKGYNDPRLLSLTAPGVADQALALGQTTKVELGEGKLAIDVRVSDERTTASTMLTAPMSGVKVSAGATKPEGSW